MSEPLGDNVMIAPGVVLPGSALRFTFSRSGGPGGQNVNKVNTRATLAVSMDDLAQVLPAHALARMDVVAGRYRVNEGLQFHAADSRSQIANRKACIAKLREVLIAAMRRPKVRRATRPSARAKQRRLDAKKQRGQIKAHRKPPRRGGMD